MKLPLLFRNCLALALLLAPGLAVSAQDLLQFDTANKLYESGKFPEAKSAYEHMVQSGPWSANLFFNLGNADWKVGDSGQAALNYERALALQPSHPEARANLEFVRGQTGARVFERPSWQRMLDALNPSAASILAALCSWVFVFCIAARILQPAARNVGVAVLIVVAILGGACAGAAIWMGRVESTKATIIARSTPARVAPADSAPVADTLAAGSEVLAPEDRGAWTYCTIPSGSRAWVASDTLRRVALPSP